MNTDEFIALALKEAQSPQFGTTEQILSVHTLVKDDGNKIAISRVDTIRDKDVVYIYFPLRDKIKSRIQDYYLVVVLRKNEKDMWEMSASYIEAKTRVSLVIISDNLSPEDISKRVQLIPTRLVHKGETYPWNRNKVSKDNQWIFEPQKDMPEELGIKMEYLLKKLAPVEINIASLPDDVYKCINVCYEGYQEWMSGFHFNQSQLNIIANLKVELDFDLYASGPEMKDS